MQVKRSRSGRFISVAWVVWGQSAQVCQPTLVTDLLMVALFYYLFVQQEQIHKLSSNCSEVCVAEVGLSSDTPFNYTDPKS